MDIQDIDGYLRTPFTLAVEKFSNEVRSIGLDGGMSVYDSTKLFLKPNAVNTTST